MELKIQGKVEDVHTISSTEYNVMAINSVSIKYKDWRQKSKAPTFALT